MKIVLYGATGMIGSRILKELLSRGHRVTAVVRNPSKLSPGQNGIEVKQGDISDPENVAASVKGADAIICSYGPPAEAPDELVNVTKKLLQGVQRSGVKRLLVVGGAGSLEVAPGVRLLDTPNFPAFVKPIATAAANSLQLIRNSDLDWTYLSPAATIKPGERTGKFRVGGEQLLTDSKGSSEISAEDYAIAMVDELENPKHIRQRFTVAY